MIDIQHIATTFNLRQHGNRYSGPCPKCGGSARSDKFSIRTDGGFKCYACGFKGDAITWLREIERMSCPEAFSAAGMSCTRSSCAVWSTCRMGKGGEQPAKRLPQSVTVPVAAEARQRATEQRDPQAVWLKWASNLLDKARANLAGDRATLDYLAGRGIGQAAAREYRLGVLTHPERLNRASIGLPPERNGKAHLWVPAGLVIPSFDASGRLHRLRIRRTAEDREQFRGDLKYVWIEGSGNAPLLIRRDGAPGTVVVEAELDAIAIAAAHPGVNAMALGTVDMPPTAEQAGLLRETPVVLVALDADSESAAGQKAVRRWLTEWPQAKAWPVPAGKDPGDYVAGGGQLTAWVTAGLPPRVKASQLARQDDRPDTLQAPAGGAGPVDSILLRGVSRHGVDYAVVPSAKELQAAKQEAPGAVLFTSAEVNHCRGMQADEADAVMMVKQLFDGATVIWYGAV